MKVTETHIPKGTFTGLIVNKVDYSDCFELITDKNYCIKLIISYFLSFPKWVLFLFKLRNILVTSFGLRTLKLQDISIREIKWEKGNYITFFEIKEIENNEIAICGKDSHLNAGFIIKKITNNSMFHYYFISVVEYNNKLGKLYMTVIRPFHKLIFKNMIKRTKKYKNYEEII